MSLKSPSNLKNLGLMNSIPVLIRKWRRSCKNMISQAAHFWGGGF